MLRKWWHKYCCSHHRNQVDRSSVASTNIVLTSYEQVWPPIPINWKYVSASYTEKFSVYHRQNEKDDGQIFKVVLLSERENLTTYQVKLDYLQNIIDHINIFSDVNECTDFIVRATNYNIQLLIFPPVKQEVLLLIRNMNQVQNIYIFSDADFNNQDDIIRTKIKYVSFENIETFGKLLLEEKKRLDNMTFTSTNINQLNSSFMYSVLLKEILLELEYDDETAKQDFIDYCRYEYADNVATLRTINRFAIDYCQERVIYWYSQPCFFFELLYRSLRTQDIEILIRISFILRHLHKQIDHLHSMQFSSMSSVFFHVYRGQGMKRKEFDQKIKNKIGGLLSFNSFLSTSRDADVADIFIVRNDLDSVAVLFDIVIDRNISRCPFAAVSQDSAITDENEILFSMHSIFRIQTVEEDVANGTWRVSLSLTNENDQQLHTLTAYVRKIIDAPTGWNRLENLMMEMGKWNMVKPLIEASLSSSLEDNNKRAYIHHQLGVVNAMIGDYRMALEHYKKSLNLKSPKNLLGLASTHSGIGSVLEIQGQLSEALNEYKSALSFIRKLEQPNIEALTSVQSNIAAVLQRQGKLLEALDIHEECLRLEIEHLPALHPHLAISYSNVASIYDDLNEWETALKFELIALDIEERSLPSDHPSLAVTHSNIALTLHTLNRREEALAHLHKTIEIESKYLPSDDPSLIRHHKLLEKFSREI